MDFIEELNDLFMEVKDLEQTYENLGDGEYLAKVTNAEYRLSKADKPMVMFTFEITDGEFKGRKHNKFMMLSGKDETSLKGNLTRYGNELKKYGIVATSIQDSFDKLKDIIGTEVKLTIKTTENGFTNTQVELIEE